jgi:hypothetical protein
VIATIPSPAKGEATQPAPADPLRCARLGFVFRSRGYVGRSKGGHMYIGVGTLVIILIIIILILIF